MSDKLRDALLEIQGTCQEVAHEVEDPTQAVAEIEATTRKALRAKSEPVVPLSEAREALLGEEAEKAAALAYQEAGATPWAPAIAAAGRARIDAAFPSTDSEGQS